MSKTIFSVSLLRGCKIIADENQKKNRVNKTSQMLG